MLTLGQNVRLTWSEYPLDMVKMSASGGQNVRYNSFYVIVSFNSFYVIAGAKLTLAHSFYFFSIFFQQASFTHSENGCLPRSESILSTKSFSKRIFFFVEVVRLSERGELFLLSSCIGCAPILYCCGAHQFKPITEF